MNKINLIRGLAVGAFSLVLAGSGLVLAATTAPAAATPKPSGTISADPNPCTIQTGQTTCATTIKWSFKNASSADVCVRKGGDAYKLFASVPASSGDNAKNAPWITEDLYTFILKAPAKNCGGTTLSAASVTGKKAPVVVAGNAECNPGQVETADGRCIGQGQDQKQNQNQQQNNNQSTSVNVTNENNNSTNITMTGEVAGTTTKPEVQANATVPEKSPETGASAAATALLFSGAPAGIWLRKVGVGMSSAVSRISDGSLFASIVEERKNNVG